MFNKNFNDPRDVNSFATNYFALFCFSLFWWGETLNNFLSAPLCFLLIISFGISHGALDNEKGKKLLRKFKIKNILLFYLSYIFVSLIILLFWFYFPTLTLSLFLIVAAYHFGKEDSEIMGPKKNVFLKVIYFLKGSIVILAPLFFKYNETSNLFDILNFNLELLSYLNENNLIKIFFYISLISNLYFLIENIGENYDFIILDLLSINLLFYLLSPLAAFSLYFCFIHSLRHTVSLCNNLDKKSLSKGFKRFLKKALPLTIITAVIFIIVVFILIKYNTLDFALLNVIFIGLASLTFPHILLEYLLEKNEK